MVLEAGDLLRTIFLDCAQYMKHEVGGKEGERGRQKRKGILFYSRRSTVCSCGETNGMCRYTCYPCLDFRSVDID